MAAKLFASVFIVSLLGYCQCTSYFKFVRGPPGSNGPPGKNGPATSSPICDKRIQALEEQLKALDVRLKNTIKVSGASGNKCGPDKFTYKFVAQKKHWQGAVEHCKSLGGVLAHSEARTLYERMNMMQSHKQSKDAAIWWGASDLGKEGDWRYINGDPVNMATFEWRRNEPNGNTWENCASTWWGSQIIDYKCSIPLPFFCEFETCKTVTGL